MNARLLVAPLFVSVVALASGCAEKATVASPQVPVTETSSGTIEAHATNGNVAVSDEIARACNIAFDDVSTAPKFRFDESALLLQDRGVLAQVARCVTTGPLKGRRIELVGRADPRGEAEYNMALGEHRAGSAYAYLSALGVAKDKMAETSRGKLDAIGNDEASWQLDRRVDILLM